jgi:hypothetical protein
MRPILTLSLLLLGAVPSGDDLDAAIRRQLDREHVPALTFAVVRHGNILRQGAYGLANLEWKALATIHTKFEVASVSKMFVGAAVRILIEEGRLDPEDPIGKYFENIPESWTGMRLRYLITMSSGLPDDWGSESKEVTRRLFLLGGNMNGRERAGAVKHRELARVPAVGLDAIARTSRDERRGNHVARDLPTLEGAAKLKAPRARFVATADRSLAAQPLDEFQNGGTVRRQRVKRRRPVPWE